jgi:hypothetical protein
MMRGSLLLIASLAVVSACKDKRPEVTPGPTGSGSGTHDDLSASAVDRPKVKIDGPSVAPVITSSITFAVPKDAPWWGEMAFACYAAAINLQPGNSPASAFTQISPAVAPALAAADIDLDKDLQAIGLWGCGEAACFYTALTLRHPEKIPLMFAQLVPGAPPKEVGKSHWTIAAPGAQGPRTIHIQAVPIAWPDKLPSDSWSRDAARATHLVFVTGLFGKSTEIDPLTALADAPTATAKVTDVESVLHDAHGRCMIGAVGKREFKKGFGLDRARFALAAPEGKGDALTQLLGSIRTLDLEIELTLTPAVTEATVQKWIGEARAWMSTTMAPVRAQFAAQGAMVDVMFDLAGLLGERGFKHTIQDKALGLSWRTDRVPEAELMSYESKLQAAMGPGATP